MSLTNAQGWVASSAIRPVEPPSAQGDAPSPPSSPAIEGRLPEISVIVGAYSRREFLLSAVRSVVAQMREGLSLEVIVVVNFRDPSRERELTDWGVQLRFDPRPGLERWIDAARSARAPLIAFLDDDDLFDTRRLSRVREVFSQHPEVGFYRNRVYLLTPGGTVDTDWANWGGLYRDSHLDRSGPRLMTPEEIRSRLAGLLEIHGSFNASTMVLRRELLEAPAFDELSGGRQFDLALFVQALLSGKALYLDPERLTGYRRHPASETRRPEWIQMVAAAGTSRRLAAQARRAGLVDLSRWLSREQLRLERSKAIDLLLSGLSNAGSTGGRTALILLGQYLAFLARNPRLVRPDRDTWFPVYRVLRVMASSPMIRRKERVDRSTAHRRRRPSVHLRQRATASGAAGNGAALQSRRTL